MIFGIIFVLFQTGPTTYSGLEIYHPLEVDEVAITSAGEAYIVDKSGYRVLHFNSQGKLINSFGREGEGPGEFLSTRNIQYFDEQVFIWDMSLQKINIFDSKGQFVRALFTSMPLFRTQTGWVKYRQGSKSENSRQLLSYEPDMNKMHIMYDWEPQRIAPLPTAKRGANTAYMQPAFERDWFVVGHQKRFIFIAHMGVRFKITVYDTQEQSIRHIIKDIQPVPYDVDWAEGKIRGANKGLRGMKFKLKAPKYFPMIRKFMVTPEGLLVVQRWTGMPDKTKNYLVMDRNGNQAHLDYNPSIVERVFDIVDGSAFISIYDSEHGAGILKCSVKDIDGIGKSHPIQYEKRVRPFTVDK